MEDESCDRSITRVVKGDARKTDCCRFDLDPAASFTMKRNMHRAAAQCRFIEKAIQTLLLLAGSVKAVPSIAFPINSQVPPVARVSEPYQFTFSSSTFTTALQEVQYSLTSPPDWLELNSSTRTFYGMPEAKDVGSVSFGLVASDTTGPSTMSVTFVVSADPGPGLGLPIEQQLQSLGTFSYPDGLLMYPSSLISISFGLNTFTNTNDQTVYYAISANNTPLPSWINFEPSTLSFSGRTPSFTSPTELPQEFGIQLIASDVVGFAAAVTSFQVVVTDHELKFTNAVATLNISPSIHFNYSISQRDLSLDNQTVDLSSLTISTANVPKWLSLDTQTLVVSGMPPADVMSQNSSISVTDQYGDIAYLILQLLVSVSSKMIDGSIGTLEALIGSNLTYKFNTNLFTTPHLDVTVTLGKTSSWLKFDNSTLTLSGMVPADLEPQVIQLTLDASDGLHSQFQYFNISLVLYITGDASITLPAGSSPPTSVPTSTVGQMMQPGPNNVSRSPLSGAKIAGVVIGTGVALFLVLFLLLWARKRRHRRNREGYLGAWKRKISRPTLQRPDEWEEKTEPNEKSTFGHRRISSRAPKIEILNDFRLSRAGGQQAQTDISPRTKRRSRASKFGSWGILRSSFLSLASDKLEGPGYDGVPNLSTVNERVAPLGAANSTCGPKQRKFSAGRTSLIMKLSPAASTSTCPIRHRSHRSHASPITPSRPVSGFGHGNGLNDILPLRCRSRLSNHCSTFRASYCFGHGMGSFERLPSGPSNYNQVEKSWRSPTIHSEDYESVACSSSGRQSSTRLSELPGLFPCTPRFETRVCADHMLKDVSKTIRIVNPPKRAQIPTSADQIQKYLKTRRSQHESVFFSSGPSTSRKSSSSAWMKPPMGAQAELSSDIRLDSSSSNKENSKIIKHQSSAYRKGLMMQRSVSAASSQCLPIGELRSNLNNRVQKKSSSSSSVRRAGLRSGYYLGGLRFGNSKSSLSSSQRLETANESEFEEDSLEETKEEGERTWRHIVPNPLTLHGNENRLQRISWRESQKAAPGGVERTGTGGEGTRITIGGRGKRISVEDGVMGSANVGEVIFEGDGPAFL